MPSGNPGTAGTLANVTMLPAWKASAAEGSSRARSRMAPLRKLSLERKRVFMNSPFLSL
jgi:hypothetical protein